LIAIAAFFFRFFNGNMQDLLVVFPQYEKK
jgi:hypothetical protein